MDFLTQLREKLNARIAERSAAKAELDAILVAPTAEARDLNDDEASKFADVKSKIGAADTDIDALNARIAELAAIEARQHEAAAVAPKGGAKVTSEARTYSPEAERQEGRSFFVDLVAQTSDPDAADRVRRHVAEERVERRGYVQGALERRDVGTGAFAGLTVPQYLVDLAAPVRRALKPTADLANQWALPAQGMTVEISRITTGSAAAAQATENSGVQETDMDDTLLSVPVRTIAGQQDVSIQALRRSTGVDRIVLQDLISAHDTNLGFQVINSDSTSGTHRGVLQTSGIVAVTYTSGSPTAAATYPQLFNLISQVQSGVFMGISHFVMHPRRWNWLASQVGTNFPFLQLAQNAPQVAGQVTSRAYGGVVGNIAGVDVVVDANIPTNLGAGTNQDIIIGVTQEELHLWTDPNAPLFIEAPQVGAGNLTVKYVVYSFSAFTAGRYPGAHGTIGGTGLVTPTFA